MKTVPLFSIILYLLLVISACGKGIFGDARVDGVVNDQTTSEPISFATVYLLEFNGDGGLVGGGSSILIDSTIAHSDGTFEFQYENDRNNSYYVSAKANNYFFNYKETLIQDLGIGTDVEVFLNPIAYLQIHYENLPPNFPSDILGINGDISDVLYGGDVDTSITYKVNGNYLNALHWAVGYDPTLTDSVYCISFDTTFYEITY